MRHTEPARRGGATLVAVPAPSATVTLLVPPIPCIVHDSVFDAFGWQPSDTLEWTCARGAEDLATPTSANPAGLGFVLRPPEVEFLPTELAELHLPRVALEPGARMLAPWAIDDATDLLYETRTPPSRALRLATQSLAALYWGLHDWAHFHSHGPFVERAATELQCDASALVWLALNADRIGLGAERWEATRQAAVALGAERFAAEALPFDPTPLTPAALAELAARALATSPGGAR